MTFKHPDKKLQRISRYYIDFYQKEKKNYRHNLTFLSKTPPSYLTIENPFSFDDERYTLYPNHGWQDADYDRILALDLSKKPDLAEFRYLAANLARVIYYRPEEFKQLESYPHFEAVLEFILIEGLYEYFSIDVEKLLLVCVRHKLIRSGDCGAITLSKNLIFKDWYSQLTAYEKYKFKCSQLIYKINARLYT